ncbi:MAG TPA: VTT domain-containing protein [Mycobacteriales bacterium]|nr:VTT domain-containing protein [Mycobacteriales bacterium]
MAGSARLTRGRLVVGAVVLGVLLLVVAFGGDAVAGIKHLLERLSELPGPVFAVIVGLLAMFETAAFAGLAVPGELAVILGGVAASEGKVPVAVMVSCAVGGAIVGDSLGFYLGRRLGTRFLDSRLGAIMGRARVESTMARIRAGGIKAIILGRFVGVLRAIMPFAAGASGVPYSRFLLASVIGATAWGTAFTLLGYLAGNSWQSVERYVGRASTLLAITLAVIVALVLAAKQVVARQEQLRGWWQEQLDRPRIARARQRYHRQIAFLTGRFRPGTAAGLQLTAGLLGLALLGAALALVIGESLGSGGLVDVDEPVRRALARSQTGDVVRVTSAVRDVLSAEVLGAVSILVGLGAWVVDRRPRALVLLVVAVVGAAFLAQLVSAAVERSRVIPSLTDGFRTSTFPSGRMTVMAATVLALLAVLMPRISSWGRKVVTATVGLALVLLGGLAVLSLGQVYLSDVLGGITLGGVWGLAVATAVTTVWRPPVPAGPDSGEVATDAADVPQTEAREGRTPVL